MLRYQIFTFRKTLQSKILFSTSTLDKHQKPSPLLLKLKNEFESITCIIHALKNEELNSINFDEWKTRIYMLKKYHFTDGECFKMISAYPYLLKIPLRNFERNLKQWSLAELGLANFHLLLLHQPQFLEVNEKVIRKRIPTLFVSFTAPQKLYKLLNRSPNVMFDNWEGVTEKIQYVLHEKRFTQTEVIDSQALSCTLNFIKFRLDLLEKCGIYKQDNTPIHKLNRRDKTKHKNPFLPKILNPDEQEFADLAKISHEEYLVCKNSYYQEVDVDEEEEEEDYKSSYN